MPVINEIYDYEYWYTVLEETVLSLFEGVQVHISCGCCLNITHITPSKQEGNIDFFKSS